MGRNEHLGPDRWKGSSDHRLLHPQKVPRPAKPEISSHASHSTVLDTEQRRLYRCGCDGYEIQASSSSERSDGLFEDAHTATRLWKYVEQLLRC
jgi:hypothetical protein